MNHMLLLRIFAIICSVPTPMISYMPMQDASKVKEPHLGSASGQQLVQDAVEPPNPLADRFNFKHDESAAGELGDSKVDNGDAIRDLRLRGKKPMEEAGSNKHLIDASTGPTSESSTTGVSVPAPAASFRERVVSASAAFFARTTRVARGLESDQGGPFCDGGFGDGLVAQEDRY
ncbi:hypothetical protein PCANC_27597 [Puccinia coronata f. sp. avenae]|uniref:RxLR effector candidate protein n=1 Tax=Puccinia coronata f. sp. avenae TaxID=200324 RepID=A0A2N5RW60_9BASI|nr:hypothetical protein PCANC_27597 [Puccinia coronata f. sp. avenae]